MKHLILNTLVCLTLVFIVRAQEPLQPVIMSERVGQEIDQAERAYFGLFPYVLDFKHAQTFSASKDSIVIDILAQSDETGRQNVIRKTLPFAEAQKLCDYLERFEAIAGDEADLSKGLIDTRVLARPTPAFREGLFRDDLKQMTLGTIDSNTYAGKLLYASDSVLIFWKSNAPYNWRSARRSMLVLEPTAIRFLTLHAKSQAGNGALIGFLIASVVGTGILSSGDGFLTPPLGIAAVVSAVIFGLPSALLGGIIGSAQETQRRFMIDGKLEKYARFLPKFHAKSYFVSAPAPEAARLIAERQHWSLDSSMTTPEISLLSKADTSVKVTSQIPPAAQPAPIPPITIEPNEQTTSINQPRTLSVPRFHLWIAGGLGDAMAESDIEKALQASGFGGTYNGFFGPVEYPHDQSNHFIWRLGMCYNLTRHYCVTLQMNHRPELEMEGKDDDIETATCMAYSLGLEWIPKPALPALNSRSEGVLGVGVTTNKINVTGELKSSWSLLEPTLNFPYEVTKRVWGGYVVAQVNYYLSTSASLQFGIQCHMLSKVNVPLLAHEFRQSNGISQMKTLQVHTINFSGYDISVGLQLHSF